MGRKPKIIHIPGTLEQVADAFFAKVKAKREASIQFPFFQRHRGSGSDFTIRVVSMLRRIIWASSLSG